MVRDSNVVKYQQYIAPPPPANVGDIAYWDGNVVKTIPLSSWNTGLGTPVGVVIIPDNFLPDSKTRIISINSISTNWDSSGLSNGLKSDSSTPNFTKVPTTDNAGSTTNGTNNRGRLPSDRSDWNGTQSYVDPLAKYRYDSSTPMIPSPYLGEEFNPAYAVELDGGNALSDFNGLSNTQLLVNEGEQYAAAHVCWNYKDAANSKLQWYLPAMGELGFLMPRFELINTSFQSLLDMGITTTPVNGGNASNANYITSSTELFIDNTYYNACLSPYFGLVMYDLKGYNRTFYPFAIL